MHIFDMFRVRQSDRFQAAAVALDCYAAEVSRLALQLDDTAETCSCCSAPRYRNWPQKQLRDRLEGAGTRLKEIADTLRRRAHDPEFLGKLKPDQDLLVKALTAVHERAPDAHKLVDQIMRGTAAEAEERP